MPANAIIVFVGYGSPQISVYRFGQRVVLGNGFHRVYRGPKGVCEVGPDCGTPRSVRLTKAGLWIATVLVVIAIGFPKLAPLFL